MNIDTTETSQTTAPAIGYIPGYAQVFSHRFPYRWTLKDANFTKDKGKVFSCFACGGGSTMGYKLAGFDVIGCNEIDPKMIEAYEANHNPKYAFLEPIQTFKMREDMPQELYELDILDGSPPCSSFSMAGNREKDWGKDKVFREGQAMQVLDTLFFDFIDLAKKLQPKVVVAENVKGLLLGNAKQYVRQIYREFDLAGYYCQHWLLDASKMGVPQRRERVFFIALRKDLAKPFLKQMNLFDILPEIKFEFNEPEILFGDLKTIDDDNKLTDYDLNVWNKKQPGDNDYCDTLKRIENRESNWNSKYIYDNKVCNTIASSSGSKLVCFSEPRKLNNDELKMIGSFPLDYEFITNDVKYIIGMSVPPVMTANIATEIYSQWLSKLARS
jgi:DNA (cytosine-5)-methyltransferase 1